MLADQTPSVIVQARKGMEVYSADGHKIGKVAEVWHGTDPTPGNPYCDEDECSRLEVHHGLLERRVLYVPFNAIADVTAGRVNLTMDAATVNEHDWTKQPTWIAAAAAGDSIRPIKD